MLSATEDHDEAPRARQIQMDRVRRRAGIWCDQHGHTWHQEDAGLRCWSCDLLMRGHYLPVRIPPIPDTPRIPADLLPSARIVFWASIIGWILCLAVFHFYP